MDEQVRIIFGIDLFRKGHQRLPTALGGWEIPGSFTLNLYTGMCCLVDSVHANFDVLWCLEQRRGAFLPLSHFIEEAQREEVTCLKSHSSTCQGFCPFSGPDPCVSSQLSPSSSLLSAKVVDLPLLGRAWFSPA